MADFNLNDEFNKYFKGQLYPKIFSKTQKNNAKKRNKIV